MLIFYHAPPRMKLVVVIESLKNLMGLKKKHSTISMRYLV